MMPASACEPGEAGLVDLQHQPLEERGVVGEREAVLLLMVGPVPLVAGSDVAVGVGHRYLASGLSSVFDAEYRV